MCVATQLVAKHFPFWNNTGKLFLFTNVDLRVQITGKYSAL